MPLTFSRNSVFSVLDSNLWCGKNFEIFFFFFFFFVSVGATRAQDTLRSGTSLVTTRAGLSGLSNGTHAHFIGGMSDVGFVSYSYTTETNAYSSTGSRESPSSMTLSVARGFAGAAVATSGGNTYMLVGGGNDNSNFYTDVDVYTMPARTRSTLQLSRSRREPSAGGIGKYAVFAGGTYSCGTISLKFCTSTNVDVFDASTQRFGTALALRTARYRMGVAALGNELIFAGGETSDGNEDHVGSLLSDVTIFDQTRPTSLSERGAVLSLARSRIAAASAGGVAVFAGGYDRTMAASTAVDIYDGTSWRSMGPLPMGITHARAAAVDGVIVFAGGASFDLAQARNTVLVFSSAPPTPKPTPAPTPEPTPAPTPVPTGLACPAYSGVCMQCVDPAVHNSDCRYCGTQCTAGSVACSDAVNVPSRGACPTPPPTPAPTPAPTTTNMGGNNNGSPSDVTSEGQGTGESVAAPEPEGFVWTTGAIIGVAVGAGAYCCTAYLLVVCLIAQRKNRHGNGEHDATNSSAVMMQPQSSSASSTGRSMQSTPSQARIDSPTAQMPYSFMPSETIARSSQSNLSQQPYSTESAAESQTYAGASGGASYAMIPGETKRPLY
jgi:hypothetical protein